MHFSANNYRKATYQRQRSA